jgi:hypothetical protein
VWRFLEIKEGVTRYSDGTVEGDFYLEPDTGILVIGKQLGIEI